VFGAVEHFDGLGVIRADVLVDESTDLCLSAFGCKGQKRRELGLRRDRPAEFDVGDVGPSQREVVLVDREAAGVVLGFDDVRLAVVVLSDRRKLVEPLGAVSGFDAQS